MKEFEKNIDVWKSRYTVRRFADKNSVKQEDIDYLIKLFEYIPIQQGIVNHFWLLLGPNDQDFKNFMYEKVCHVRDESEHMYAMSSAPYIFLSITHDAPCKKDVTLRGLDDADIWQKLTNIGFHAGVILTEALHMGYNVAQIACMEGKRKKKIVKQFSQRVRSSLTEDDKINYFEDPNDSERTSYKPVLAICIGEGLPISKDYPLKTTLANKPTVIGQKPKKVASNITIRTPKSG